jgi:hypothetical protein
VHHRSRVSSRHPRGNMKCLTGKDLTGYDYVSINKDGFVPISVKQAIGATRLAHDLV